MVSHLENSHLLYTLFSFSRANNFPISKCNFWVSNTIWIYWQKFTTFNLRNFSNRTPWLIFKFQMVHRVQKISYTQILSNSKLEENCGTMNFFFWKLCSKWESLKTYPLGIDELIWLMFFLIQKLLSNKIIIVTNC